MRFSLPYPTRVNRLYMHTRRGVILSTEGRDWRARAQLAGKALGLRPAPGDLSVTLRLFRPRRAGDIDGPLKALFDALNGIAWEDDSQIVELHVAKGTDKENPRVEVEVIRVA